MLLLLVEAPLTDGDCDVDEAVLLLLLLVLGVCEECHDLIVASLGSLWSSLSRYERVDAVLIVASVLYLDEGG